jgi:hypothetical protein
MDAFAAMFCFGFIAGSSFFWRLLGRETIRVRDDVLELTTKLPCYHRIRVIRREHLHSVSLENYGDESVQTLNLFVTNATWNSRIMIAYSLSRARKLFVYTWLKQCMEKRGWTCEFHCDK